MKSPGLEKEFGEFIILQKSYFSVISIVGERMMTINDHHATDQNLYCYITVPNTWHVPENQICSTVPKSLNMYHSTKRSTKHVPLY